jgi:O-antigen/teichoic acid export membrane protein
MVQRHAIIYLLGYGITAMFGLGSYAAYTHLLTPDQYGFYVIGNTTGAIISAAAFAWIRFSVSRYQSESAEADVRAIALMSYAGMLILLTVLIVV